MSNEVDFFTEDKFKMATTISEKLSRSSIVPMHFRNKPEEIFACLVLGAELGFKPMQSLNAIVLIQGQATLKAQTQLALVRSRCPSAVIKIDSDEKNLVVTCHGQRDSKDPGFTSEWNMEKAKKMGLSHKDNWCKQPSTMLRWRAISECLRIVFPDILQGIYGSEEIEDLDNDIKIDIVDYKEQGGLIEKIKYLIDLIKVPTLKEKSDLLRKINIKNISDLDRKTIEELKIDLLTLEKIFNSQDKNTIEVPKIDDENKSLIGSILNVCKILCKDMTDEQKKNWMKRELLIERFGELEAWSLVELDELLKKLDSQNIVFAEEQIEMPSWEEK